VTSDERSSRRGWFITVEGPDGSGKTLQARLLHEAAVAHGLPSLLTREPGGTWAGERIREILLGAASTNERISPRADALLFSASRAQLVDELLGPAVERGELVIDARHADSTLAYQGFGRGLGRDLVERANSVATGGVEPALVLLLDLAVEAGLSRRAVQGFGRGLDVGELRAIQRFATAGLVPDLTILLDLPIELGLARKATADENRFEIGFGREFHQRVRDGYLALAAAEPSRWAIVDAAGDPDTVHHDVLAEVGRLVPQLLS
jgi:dTMP kinase